MSSRMNSKKTASSRAVFRVPSGHGQPSSSQKLLVAGSKLFASLNPSGAPSIRSPSSSKLKSSAHKPTRHTERETRATRSSVSASLAKKGSAPRSSSMKKLHSNSKHSSVAQTATSSGKKSTVPSVPLSAVKSDLRRSIHSNRMSHATKAQGAASMAKSGIPTGNSRAIIERPASSNRRKNAHQTGRSVHIHHHHILPAPERPQLVVVHQCADLRPQPSVACQFCRCDLCDPAYSERGCCFDCGTTRGYYD